MVCKDDNNQKEVRLPRLPEIVKRDKLSTCGGEYKHVKVCAKCVVRLTCEYLKDEGWS